jgi:F-type H+-transporting ATPase subunit a
MSTALHIAHQFPALADAIPSLLASGGNPLDHVLDKPSALGEVLGIENLKLSIVSVVVSAVLAFVLLLIASRSIATGPASAGTDRYLTKGRLGQIVEVIVQGLRQGVLEPLLGKKTSDYYLPFFLSLFFFVLMMNLLGLIPFYDAQKLVMKLTAGASHDASQAGAGEAKKVFFGGTATASLSVTAGLATISFFAILYQSMRDLGVKGFLEHMCGGKELLTGPKGLLLVVPVIFVVEVLGLFIKPGALAIRLFANILAGHTLMATIFMFTGMALAGGWIVAAPVGVVSVAFAVAIYFLELFVAFLQAFVFMFLTAVFIGMMSHHGDHGHDHDHEHGHEDAHGHGHAHAHAH